MTNESHETVHHRICPFCEACCGLEITVAEGRVKRIRGHAADVFSRGYLCPKGVALKDLHEDPDRLRKPLIKREGRFVEATWEEAFAEIDRRLPPIIAKHGADSRLIGIIQGKGAAADINQIDDELLMDDLRRTAGPFADQIFKAGSQRRGVERVLDLGLRAGPYGDQFGMKPDGLNLGKVRAAEGGIDLGALEPRVPDVLRTPSGKIELAPAMLIDDLKRPAADLERSAPELMIVGRRQLHGNNSWMHNLPVLAKGAARCIALVNPTDAARLGLEDGGRARIAHDGRTIEAEVEVTGEMMPGVISLPHGWGHDQPGAQLEVAAANPGANLNALMDENRRDPLSGNAVLSGMEVEMTPVAARVLAEQAR